MTENTLLATALVLMLVAMPLLAFGTDGGTPAMWWTGLGLLALGGAAGPAARFLVEEEDG